MAKKTEDNIRATLKELQQMKADPVRFIARVKTKEYEFWKENRDKWSDEYFPKAKFAIQVKVKITATGLIN